MIKNCKNTAHLYFIQCIYNSLLLFIQHPLWSWFPPGPALHTAAVRKIKTKICSSSLQKFMHYPRYVFHVHVSVGLSAHKDGRGDGGTGSKYSLLLTLYIWSQLQTAQGWDFYTSSGRNLLHFATLGFFLQTQPGEEAGSFLGKWSGRKRW